MAEPRKNPVKAKAERDSLPSMEQINRAGDILAKEQPPDTEHPISKTRRLLKAAPPRERGARVIGFKQPDRTA